MGFRGGNPKGTSLLKLEPNSDLVPVTFNSILFDATPETSFGLSNTAPDETWNYLGHSGPSIIQKNGLIKKLRLITGTSYATSILNMVTVNFKLMRRNVGGTYDEIGKIDILSLLLAATGANNTEIEIDIESANLIAKIGDRCCFEFIGDGTNSPAMLKALDVGNASSSIIIGGTQTTEIDFEGLGTPNDGVIKCQVLMSAPWGVYLADSLGEDASQKGFLNKSDISITYSEMLSYRLMIDRLIGKDLINSCLGGVSDIATVNSTITERVLELHPRVCFVHIGGNDLAADTDNADFQTGYETLVSTLSQNDIVPVLILLFPNTTQSDAKAIKRDEYNEIISTIGKNNSLLVIDCRAKLGQPRDDIDYFNLIDISENPDYNGDGTHLNAAGQAVAAQEISNQFWSHEKAVELINSL